MKKDVFHRVNESFVDIGKGILLAALIAVMLSMPGILSVAKVKFAVNVVATVYLLGLIAFYTMSGVWYLFEGGTKHHVGTQKR